MYVCVFWSVSMFLIIAGVIHHLYSKPSQDITRWLRSNIVKHANDVLVYRTGSNCELMSLGLMRLEAKVVCMYLSTSSTIG